MISGSFCTSKLKHRCQQSANYQLEPRIKLAPVRPPSPVNNQLNVKTPAEVFRSPVTWGPWDQAATAQVPRTRTELKLHVPLSWAVHGVLKVPTHKDTNIRLPEQLSLRLWECPMLDPDIQLIVGICHGPTPTSHTFNFLACLLYYHHTFKWLQDMAGLLLRHN